MVLRVRSVVKLRLTLAGTAFLSIQKDTQEMMTISPVGM